MPRATARRHAALRILGGAGLAVGCLASPVAAFAQEGVTPPPPPPPANAQISAEERLRLLEQQLQNLQREVETLRAQAKPPAQPATGTQKPGDKPALPKFQYNGYLESRFTNVANSRGDEREEGPEFQMSRARVRLNFLPDENWLASFEVNAGTRSTSATPVDLREMYFQYMDGNRLARVGQQRLPFGFQTGLESSVNRAALERARIFTIVFPNERDIGLVLAWNNPTNNRHHQPNALRAAVGVVNGEGINRSDTNADKSYVGNVVLPLGKHQVGASFYTGSSSRNVFGSEVQDRTKRAVGVEHRYTNNKFQTQFEYVAGTLFGSDMHGGYGQLLYNTGTPGNFFTRADIFDPDTDADNDFWRRISVGWYKDFSPGFRLTAQYDFLKAEGLNFDDTWGIEAQLRF